LALVRAAQEEERSFSDYENILLRRPIGPPLPVSASALPLFNDDGVLNGAIVILRDLSRLRELEDAVRRSDQLAVAGVMAAGLAHEIKNPLGGIRGAAQLLDRELEDRDDLREYTQVMIREVGRISALLEELLDLAAPRPLQLAPVQLNAILNDIVLLQRQAFRSSKVEFILDIDPSLPLIFADEAMLSRLFLNLIKNGAEAIVEGGRVTTICRVDTNMHMLRPGSRSTPMVQVEIRDTGRGLSPEELERIFTPFHTTKERGTGLGLAVCQKIVHEHRGLIRMESTPGSGTSITISLPLLR
jgi:two-component system nitrogen regulation sensor histidine kinase GlnL